MDGPTRAHVDAIAAYLQATGQAAAIITASGSAHFEGQLGAPPINKVAVRLTWIDSLIEAQCYEQARALIAQTLRGE